MDSKYTIFVVDDIEAGRRMTEKAGKGTVLLARFRALNVLVKK